MRRHTRADPSTVGRPRSGRRAPSLFYTPSRIVVGARFLLHPVIQEIASGEKARTIWRGEQEQPILEELEQTAVPNETQEHLGELADLVTPAATNRSCGSSGKGFTRTDVLPLPGTATDAVP